MKFNKLFQQREVCSDICKIYKFYNGNRYDINVDIDSETIIRTGRRAPIPQSMSDLVDSQKF